jgi:hypothetical protein
LKSQRLPKAQSKAKLLGLGLDAKDGQTRVTRGTNFVLYGGSQETHVRMQETVVKVNEQLDRRGKRLEDCSVEELREMVHKAAG